MSNWLTGTNQFKSGKQVERWLDDYFADDYSIRQLSLDEEQRKLGDREFSFLVEYKSGIQTAFTGNVFLETISNDETGAPGWVYTCKAKFIIYACLQVGQKLDAPCILLFKPETLRANIEELKAHYGQRSTKGQNVTYKTWGVVLPIESAKFLACKIIYPVIGDPTDIRAALETEARR